MGHGHIMHTLDTLFKKELHLVKRTNISTRDPYDCRREQIILPCARGLRKLICSLETCTTISTLSLFIALLGVQRRQIHEEDADRRSLHLAGQGGHAEAGGELAQTVGEHRADQPLNQRRLNPIPNPTREKSRWCKNTNTCQEVLTLPAHRSVQPLAVRTQQQMKKKKKNHVVWSSPNGRVIGDRGVQT